MKEYSNDFGKTWEGPFSDEEMRNLTACGVVNQDTLIRECGSFDPPHASPVPVPAPAPYDNAVLDGYFVAVPGCQPQGPFSVDQIRIQIASGALPPAAQACKQGWTGWIPVMDILAVPVGAECEQTGGIGNLIADVVGTQHVKLNVKDFFSEVFKQHQPREMEAFFCAGGPYSTPMLNEAPMPRPWIYSRILVCFIVLLLGFFMLSQYSPFAGFACFSLTVNFAVPFVMLVLFAEMNVARDISWFKILKMFFFGGICSLLFTCLINIQTGQYEAYWAGPVEETAKLAACLLVAGSQIRKGGVLQGMLCGAAIGAGFAIPESIKYFADQLHILTFQALKAYAVLVDQGHIQTPENVYIWMHKTGSQIADMSMEVSYLRAALSPIMHMLYTPIVAAAAWRLMQGKEFSMQLLNNLKFYRLALVGVLLHSFWNAPILLNSNAEILVKVVIVTVIGWTVVFLLLREGVAKLKDGDNLTQNPNL